MPSGFWVLVRPRTRRWLAFAAIPCIQRLQATSSRHRCNIFRRYSSGCLAHSQFSQPGARADALIGVQDYRVSIHKPELLLCKVPRSLFNSWDGCRLASIERRCGRVFKVVGLVCLSSFLPALKLQIQPQSLNNSRSDPLASPARRHPFRSRGRLCDRCIENARRRATPFSRLWRL